MDEKKLRKIWEQMASELYLESKETHVTYKDSHTVDGLSEEDVILVEDSHESFSESSFSESSQDDEKKTLSGKTIDFQEDIANTLSGKTGDSNAVINISSKSIFSNNDIDYEVFEEINRGGMGTISRGFQKGLKRDIAIKEILAKNKESRSHREKFISEALVTAYLDHPNIVPVYELRENKDGEIFLAMKLIDGVSWKEILRSQKDRYSFTDHLKILLNVCNAVAFAHSKEIVHNDLKPENIMVGKFGEVFVMDWGIAVDISADPEKRTLHKSQVNKPMGTPCYMPVELAEGRGQDIGPSTDVYLLGAILYEIATGKPPHSAETVWLSILSCRERETYEYPHGTSDEIKDICNIALSKDQSERFQNVQEFQQALEGYLQHRESATISEEAKKILENCRTTVNSISQKKIKMKEAERNRLYSEFAQAVAYFQQALMLWDGNSIAYRGELQARCSYAEFALLNGDIGLAEAQAELLKVNDHSQSSTILLKVQKAKNNKARYEKRYRNLRYMLLAAIVFIIAGLTIFTFSLHEEKRRTEIQTEEAARQREFAFNRRNEAINKADEAKKAKEEVEKYAQKLEEQKKKIADEAQQAKTILAQIALQKASEAYDNAQWKSCGTYAGLGLELLKEFNHGDDIQNLREQNSSFVRLALQKEGIIWKTTPGYAKKINDMLCISEDSILITAADDREIRIWDIITGKEKFSFAGHTDKVNKLAYDEKNKVLISASGDNTIRFWSLIDKQLIDSVYCDNFEVQSITSYDHTVAVGSKNQIVLIQFQGNSYEVTSKIKVTQTPTTSLIFTQDGQNIVWGSNNLVVTLDTKDKSIQFFEKHKNIIQTVATIPNSLENFITTEKNIIFLWRKDRNSYRIEDTFSLIQNDIKGIYPIDDTLFLLHSERSLLLYNRKKKEELLLANYDFIHSICYYPQKTKVFISSDQQIQILNLNNREEKYDLPAHTGEVTSVVFNANGKKVASASEDKSIRLWDTQTGKQSDILYGHEGKITALTFHPQQDILASASEDKSLHLWNLENNTNYVFAGHNDDITTVTCHPNQNLLASGGKDKSINVWEIPNGNLQYTLKGHKGTVNTLAYNSSGTLLASGSSDNNIIIWSKGQKLFLLEGHTDVVNKVIFHPNNLILASASNDKNIILWNLKTGKKIKTLSGHKQAVISLLFSPDGKILISGGKDKYVVLWDIQSDKKKLLKSHSAWVTDLKSDNTGNYFLSASSDSNIFSHLYNGSTQKQYDHSSDISSLSFHSTKSIFASSSGTNIYIWDSNGSKIFQLRGHSSWIKSLCFRPNGDELVSSSSDKTVIVWNSFLGRKVIELKEHESDVNNVLYSSDGKYFMSVSKNTIIMWNADSKHMESKILSGHTQKINDVAFSPDGQTLASVSSDNSLRIWDINLQRVVHVFEGHNSEINAVDYSPKGKFIATASSDKTIRIWDLERGKTIFVLFGHEGEVKDIAYNPSGNAIATSSTDSTIKVWNIATGKPTATFANISGVESLKYSKDGRTLMVALANNNIELWDIATEKRLEVLTGHTNSVKDVDYSPDGKQIVSASKDQTIRLWNIPNNIDISLFKGHNYQNVLGAAYDRQSSLFYSIGSDRKIYAWNHEETKPQLISAEQKDSLTTIAFNPATEKRIVCGNNQGQITFYDQNLNTLYSFDAHQSSISDVECSSDGKILATCAQDQQIHLWKIEKQNKLWQKKIATLDKHDAKVTSVCFSTDGNFLVSGSEDKTVRVWNTTNQEQKFVLSRHKGKINKVVVSSNDKIIASASDDQTVRLWDAKKGISIHILQEHSAPVLSVSFSYDNSYLLSSSQDGKIIMWDVTTGKMLSNFSLYNTVANQVLYHPNDIGFVSICSDKIIRFWSFKQNKFKSDETTLPSWFKALLPKEQDILVHPSTFDVRSDIPGYLLEYIIMQSPQKVTESLFDSEATSTFGIMNQVPYTLFEKRN